MYDLSAVNKSYNIRKIKIPFKVIQGHEN